MRRIKIEIPIILLTIIIVSLLGLSGNFVYKSLSEIVNSMLSESKPDNTLILVKDVVSDLNETENMVRLYSLSNNKEYLERYKELELSREEKIRDIEKLTFADSTSMILIDSLLLLSQHKAVVWEEILTLHLTRGDEHEAFNQYVETLDTILTVQDTIHFQEPEKRGFFKRIFGKKQEPPTPIVVDRSSEKETLRQEIEDLEMEIEQRNKRISWREAFYMRKNLEISEALSGIITTLELLEEQSLQQKSQDAELLAAETYRRLILFAISVLSLLILVLLLFFRDLRKSRSYQSVLQKAKTQAENLARTKELFVATVSHEMRTPVNAIFGLSEQLLQQQHDDKTQKDLKIIYDSTKHLTDLVNDTFDFSRIEKQNIQLVPVDFSFDELLHKIDLYNRENANEKRIRFIIEKKNSENIILYGDEGRLKQILNNLVSNAIKFTDAGTVRLRSEAIETDSKIQLSITVEDTGIGIPKESQSKIFDDFVQLETDANKKAGGTGLGLYIVKKLVVLLGGNISVESELNVGTKFFINIPFEKGDPGKIQLAFKSYEAPEPLKNKKVLIVDDEEFNRHLLKNIFTKWKVDFEEAENGIEAVERCNKEDYALILMDIRMPKMNGTEAAKQIKASGITIKIIALSANSGEMESELNEFDSFLKKPFNEAALFNTIAETFGDEISPIKNENTLQDSFHPDLSELERMGNGDTGFLKEMISLFIKTSTASLQSIEENLETKDFEAIAELAHKLASPVKYMNVTEVYKTVKELEKLAKEGTQTSIISKKSVQLKTEIEALNKELKVLLDKKFN